MCVQLGWAGWVGWGLVAKNCPTCVEWGDAKPVDIMLRIVAKPEREVRIEVLLVAMSSHLYETSFINIKDV